MSRADELELHDIQGNTVRGYGSSLPVALHLFLRIEGGGPGRGFVKRLCPEIASAEPWRDGPPASAINVALTSSGLSALGVPADSIASFSVPFLAGMGGRSAILGDIEENAPRNWDPAWRQRIDLWLSVYARDDRVLAERADRLRADVEWWPGVSIVGEQAAARIGRAGKPGAYEHFGFRDGIGNPRVLADGAGGEPRLTAPGEFIFGYRDEADEVPLPQQPPTLGKNGTYIVYRKLRQRVGGFHRFLRAKAEELQIDEEMLAAKIVGRHRDGAPLRTSGNRPDETGNANPGNDFDFADDPDGVACPLGAHIRRANPRLASPHFKDTLVRRHRLLRRGITYGPASENPHEDPDEIDRGMLFIVVNTGIERQFEFVQQQWLNAGNAVRQGNDRDVLAGIQDGSGKMVIQADRPARPLLVDGIRPFVTLRGGEYFFVPGLRALSAIADGRVHRMA